MILILYAFAREVGPFKRRLAGRTALDLEGLRGFRARRRGTEVVGVATGIGIARAADAARRAMRALPSADLVIAAGLAGALGDELRPGHLVLADRLILERGDAHPPTAIAVSAAELARLRRAMDSRRVPFVTGAMLTVAKLLGTGAAKREARARSGASAVDMESSAIADEAARRGLRFGCVRAVLDAADEDIVGAELAGPGGEVSALRAAGFILRSPTAIVGLARTMRRLNRATTALASALEAIVDAEG